MMNETDFLLALDNKTDRELFARITALTLNELPTETIEGRVTGGSINIDGNSALRRTCNLTMVADEVNINDYYWGLHSKVKIEIGIKNTIDEDRPDIIWFPQGIFVLTAFNTSHTTNNYQISLNGKDKMCLLNGDIGGALTATVVFSEREIYDLENKTVITEYIPFKEIIREAVHTFGMEPYHNIIINDLDDYGIELLEYRGETPIYFLKNIEDDAYTNITVYGDMMVFPENSDIAKKLSEIECLPLTELVMKEGTIISPALQNRYEQYIPSKEKYYVAKAENGQTAGFRKTDLIWPGAKKNQLVGNTGESLTSVLDKITKILYGDFEYFYDTEGHFIFQKKKIYVNTTWNPIKENGDGIYVDNSPENGPITYEFNNSNLISSFANNPNLLNLRNDFSIWGVRESVTGAEIPVHLRYAIDNKPTYYKTYKGKVYTSDKYDWRELIYQMAKDYYDYNQQDDFLYTIANNNRDYYPSGVTGYEQYYIDLIGFWRQLYCYNELQTEDDIIDPNYTYYDIDENGELKLQNYFIKWSTLDNYDVLYYKKWSNKHQDYIYQAVGPAKQESIFNYKKYKTFYLDSYETYYVNNLFKKIELTAETYEPSKYYIKWNDQYILSNDDYFPKEEYYSKFDVDETTGEVIENMTYYIFKLPEESERNIYEYEFKKDLKYYKSAESNESKVLIYQQDAASQTWSIINLLNYDARTYWNKTVIDTPENLNFWFDFLDQYGELDRYSVQAIGDRPKVVNDNQITAIYFRETPTVLFVQNEEDKIGTEEYTWVQLPEKMNTSGILTPSTQKKSAQEQLDNLLYNYSYCIENVNLSIIPIYRLEPNTLIKIQDEKSKINGQYVISKMTIPLAYNGTMTINATKAVERLY